MVTFSRHPHFKKVFSKLKDQNTKDKLITQLKKIRKNPEVGKPMKHSRKGTRELYVNPYRLSYVYVEEEDKIVLLDLYHKDKQ
jgi:mRNA-degrading endonuclease RelE of RelBE toxin-antitoxin system